MKASPRIRFNKEGTLLAVSANDNRIKILATVDGMRLIRTYENHSLVAARSASETVTRVCLVKSSFVELIREKDIKRIDYRFNKRRKDGRGE